jgi:hypothetical protein
VGKFVPGSGRAVGASTQPHGFDQFPGLHLLVFGVSKPNHDAYQVGFGIFSRACLRWSGLKGRERNLTSGIDLGFIGFIFTFHHEPVGEKPTVGIKTGSRGGTNKARPYIRKERGSPMESSESLEPKKHDLQFSPHSFMGPCFSSISGYHSPK